MLTGKQIIDILRDEPTEYQHLSPAFTQAVVEYVAGIETALTEAMKILRPLDCQGYDGQWCNTSCACWKVCMALKGEKP